MSPRRFSKKKKKLYSPTYAGSTVSISNKITTNYLHIILCTLRWYDGVGGVLLYTSRAYSLN